MSLRWTEEQFNDYLGKAKARVSAGYDVPKPPKPSKYRNQKITVDGETFDSKKEYQRYRELKMMEKAGKVTDVKRQVPFILLPAVQINGRKKPDCKYVADFTYKQGGKNIIEDVKSEITRKDKTYRLKLHMMKALLGLDVRES